MSFYSLTPRVDLNKLKSTSKSNIKVHLFN